MDTWNVARIALDAVFAILVGGLISGFLYYREKKIRKTFAAPPVGEESISVVTRVSAQSFQPPALSGYAAIEPTRSRIQNAGSQRSSAPTAGSQRISRVEKYLEAVRLYRQGNNRSEIEQQLGISSIELELLGLAK